MRKLTPPPHMISHMHYCSPGPLKYLLRIHSINSISTKTALIRDWRVFIIANLDTIIPKPEVQDGSCCISNDYNYFVAVFCVPGDCSKGREPSVLQTEIAAKEESSQCYKLRLQQRKRALSARN